MFDYVVRLAKIHNCNFLLYLHQKGLVLDRHYSDSKLSIDVGTTVSPVDFAHTSFSELSLEPKLFCWLLFYKSDLI